MKKKNLFFLSLGLCLCGLSNVPSASATETEESTPTIVLTFNDEATAARLGVGGETGYKFTIDWGDGQEVEYDEAAYYTHLLTPGKPVKIYGEEIELLQAVGQGIATADLTHAVNVSRIQLGQNGLSVLSLGNMPLLTGLYAELNSLKAIDLSGCPALKLVDLHENQIEGTIDCSAMESLSKIDVADNALTALILPKSPTVYEVDCSNNQISEIDVADLGEMESLMVNNNLLASLDLSGLDALTDLYCGDNFLKELSIEGCPALTTLQASGNQLETIDLSPLGNLTSLYLYDNNLSELDITSCPDLRWMNIENNHIAALDLSGQAAFSLIIANNNELAEIDVTGNPNISRLELGGNRLTAIDLSSQSYLSQLLLADNNLTSLDVSHNAYLYWLRANNNMIEDIDLSANTYVQWIALSGNRLTALDITANRSLQGLELASNLMEAEALNDVIASLPDVSSVEVSEYNEQFARQFAISYNPGTADADVVEAETKGWIVSAEVSGETSLTPASITEGDEEATVSYINAAGLGSDKPFEGFNIVVRTYPDGSRTLTKAMN